MGPFGILLFLVAGLVLGATVFPKRWLGINSRFITAGLVIVLFSMGVTLGGSPTFVQDIMSAGGQAAVFAVATIAGSVFFVWLFASFFFKET